MYVHPQYVGLFVYEGQKGEKPKAGAFFAPKHGMTLTQVAWNAYGPGHDKLVYARKINGNLWNVERGRAGTVVYRDSDTNCSAKKVSPDQPPGAASAQFLKGPWIAQCPTADPGQVFWIPPKDQWDKRPEDLSAPKTYTPPKVGFGAPADPDLPKFGFGDQEDEPESPGGPEAPGVEPEKDSKKWWIIGGVAAALAAAGLGIYAWRKRKK